MKGLYFTESPLFIFPLLKSSFSIQQKKILKIILYTHRNKDLCRFEGRENYFWRKVNHLAMKYVELMGRHKRLLIFDK